MPPADLSEDELNYWNSVHAILHGLVYEMREKGFFRTRQDIARDKETGEQMSVILDRINMRLFMTNHITNALTSNEEASYSCLKSCLGFSKEDSMSFWVYEILSVFVESTELLTKNLSILMHLKKPFRPKITFGDFIWVLSKECPRFGPSLANELDMRLRNAVVHGIYWMSWRNDASTGSISDLEFYYSDELGKEPLVEPLDVVLPRLRRHNLVGMCLAELLHAEIGAGFLG